jgi:hypothetical protein
VYAGADEPGLAKSLKRARTELALVDLDRLSVALVSPTTHVAQVGSGLHDIEALLIVRYVHQIYRSGAHLGDGVSLAVVESLDGAQLGGILLELLGELDQEASALVTGDLCAAISKARRR